MRMCWAGTKTVEDEFGGEKSSLYSNDLSKLYSREITNDTNVLCQGEGNKHRIKSIPEQRVEISHAWNQPNFFFFLFLSRTPAIFGKEAAYGCYQVS